MSNRVVDMGDLADLIDINETAPSLCHQLSHSSSKGSLQIITIAASSKGSDAFVGGSMSRRSFRSEVVGDLIVFTPVMLEEWLPITGSRNGTVLTSIFHLLCSGIGFQTLLLPLAFAMLGWVWGTIALSLVFIWQIYTTWILVNLHEPVPGTRYSRYVRLSIVAFGPKLGKLLAIFPVMYLSSGSCVMLVITGGLTMEQLYKIMCGGEGHACDQAKSLSGPEWFLVFTCIAIVIVQLPKLNSIARVSMIGAITAIAYCTLIWVLPIKDGRKLTGVSHETVLTSIETGMAGFSRILTAIGIIVFACRGHNLILEIQGTLPSSEKHPSKKKMLRAVFLSYLLIASCFFPLAIVGYWAYGNKIPTIGGIIIPYLDFYGHNYSKLVKCLIHILVIISCLSSFPIYAMPAFDNIELIYSIKKKKACPWWLRTGFRIIYGGIAFFIAVALPFLPFLGGLIGGLALPLTFVYPCFMWVKMKKPKRTSGMWWGNIMLGSLGIVGSVMVVVTSAWNLADKGLHANFFKP